MMNPVSFASRASLALAAALWASASLACTCVYEGPFTDFAKQHPIIVRGTVQSYGDTLRNHSDRFETMTVTVREIIKGDFPHRQFEFFGDTGMSCLRFITLHDYPIGSEHLFILRDTETVQPLMVCDESSVEIIDNSVHGRVHVPEGIRSYEEALETFLQKLSPTERPR